MGFRLNSQKSSNSPPTIPVGLYLKILIFFGLGSILFTSQNMFMALIFSKSHNGLVTTLFLHLKDWAHGPYILHIMIQPMAYASFCGMGLNLHLSMSSQIGNIAHIIANLILWAHGPPPSHLTDWAGSPYFFSSRDQDSRLTLFLLSLHGRFPHKIGPFSFISI